MAATAPHAPRRIRRWRRSQHRMELRSEERRLADLAYMNYSPDNSPSLVTHRMIARVDARGRFIGWDRKVVPFAERVQLLGSRP